MVCRMAAIDVQVANNLSSQIGSCRHICNRLKREQPTCHLALLWPPGLEHTDDPMMGIAKGLSLMGIKTAIDLGLTVPIVVDGFHSLESRSAVEARSPTS